ncbi:Fe(3+)-hydroxamate ABC transporter permease FhuB [Psychrobacter raelei]|uniref:Fe(3+)-hydroxamate ABC transporter permease FhuB n=1 Tax=Psychrobacter raelei TaxID=2565531 RepID=UPI003F625F2C
MTSNNRHSMPNSNQNKDNSNSHLPKRSTQAATDRPVAVSSLASAVEVKHWRAWALILILLGAIAISSSVLIDRLWELPVSQLFKSSFTLDVADMAVQLKLVATSVVALLAGGLLGVVSVLLQQLVKNPLASDTTLAIGTGAQLALLIATLFVPSLAIYGGVWIAFVGALFSLVLVFSLSAPSRFNPLILVLAGLVVNILLASFASTLVLFFTEHSVGILSWAAGFLTQNNWHTTVKLAVTAIALAAISIPLLKPLTLMSLDDMQAKRLGVPINALRLAVIAIVAIVSALVVSEVGLIGFIGLAAASLVNALGIGSIGRRLVAAFGFGALLLWLTSNVALLLEPVMGTPIPAGSITGVLGAPLIIWLILRQRRQGVTPITPMFTPQRKAINWWRWSVGVLLLIALVSVWVKDLSGIAFSTDWALTQQYRLPRTLSAAATGVMLATAGVLLQTLTRNPMASPEVLGISSGAALGVIGGFLLLPAFGIKAGALSLVGSGLAGAFLVLLLIIWLARKVTPAYLLLVGIGIAAMMDGIMSMVKLSGDPRLEAMLSWLSGTTYSASPETVWYLIIAAAGLVALSMLLIKPLRVLGLGESVAKSLGVKVRFYQLALLIVVAALSTVSTLAVGPLSFIGLMVPHLATSLGAVQLEKQLPLAALLGAGVMVLADWIGRYIIFPYELPAGTIAAIIGGLYFIWLIRRSSVHQ